MVLAPVTLQKPEKRPAPAACASQRGDAQIQERKSAKTSHAAKPEEKARAPHSRLANLRKSRLRHAAASPAGERALRASA
jgi:hypothetical protein